jgi:hypothetical protein
MALAETAFFELRLGTIQRIFTRVLTPLGNAESPIGRQDLVNVQGIIFR